MFSYQGQVLPRDVVLVIMRQLASLDLSGVQTARLVARRINQDVVIKEWWEKWVLDLLWVDGLICQHHFGITGLLVLDRPGFYRFATNLYGAVSIQHSHVHLDLQGRCLLPDPTKLHSVAIQGQDCEFVVVRNGGVLVPPLQSSSSYLNDVDDASFCLLGRDSTSERVTCAGVLFTRFISPTISDLHVSYTLDELEPFQHHVSEKTKRDK